MRIALAACALTAVVASITSPSPARAADKPADDFKITTRKTDDAITAQAEKDKVIFVVKSPTGISRGEIERKGDKWPDSVVLRLQLKGLESFRVGNGKETIDGSVSIVDGKPQAKLWKNGKEGDGIDSKSPLWMVVRVIGADGKPSTDIPLKGGYFEMTVPAAFLAENPKSISLNWIDFHR
jgi:hypothetical protein